MLIGACDLVPGISGGTMALILGIYEPLMNSIAELKKCSFKHLKFFSLILGGILISLLFLSSFFHQLLQSENKVYLYSLFFGLVMGSALYVGKEIPKWTKRTFVLLILGAVCAWAVTHTPVLISPPSGALFYVWLVISGSLAVLAMLLPGISGSYLMMILGPYPLVIENLALLSRKGDLASLKVLAPVGLGIVCGGAFFSKWISYALKTHKATTLGILLGFMIGAASTVFPFEGIPPIKISTLGAISTMFFGGFLVLALESKFVKKIYIKA